jgi:hypothetical protein
MSKEISMLKRKSRILSQIIRITYGKRKEKENIQQLIKDLEQINKLLNL